MFRRRNKTKERQKKTEELVDLEAGHYNGGLQQQYLFTERDVNSAMDMARAALDGTRRRAEQAEGEAALLSVQLQENSKQLGKEKERRAKLEKNLSSKTKEVRKIQSELIESITSNRASEKELQKLLQNTRKQLEKAEEKLAGRTNELLKLKAVKQKIEQELEDLKGRLSNTTSANITKSFEISDVSEAALKLARALEDVGFQGLETETSATASAALSLAAALSSRSANADGDTISDANSSGSVTHLENERRNSDANSKFAESCITPESHDMENINPNGFMERAYRTAPDKVRNRLGYFSGSKSDLVLPVTNMEPFRQQDNNRKNKQSPWPISSAIGQFLSWTQTNNTPLSSNKRVTAKENSFHDEELQYSVSSWQ